MIQLAFIRYITNVTVEPLNLVQIKIIWQEKQPKTKHSTLIKIYKE